MSSTRWYPLGGVLLLAACQAAPVVGPGPSAAPVASQGPSGAPASASPTGAAPASPQASGGATTAPSPTVGPAVSRELVLGTIYNDRGGLVDAAQVVVEADDPSFDRTITAAGGAYAVRDVPVGTTLTITASAPGYTARTQRLTVKPVVPGYDEEPNRVDFGADGPSYWFYLTKASEITRTTPENLSEDQRVDGIEVTFEFSSRIPQDQRGAFEDLIRVRVPGTTSEGFLTTRTSIGKADAGVEWDNDGQRAVFSFPMPIVIRSSDATVIVDLDPEADPEDYPKDENGERLGIDRVFETREGSGTTVRNRVAAFARPLLTEPIPSVRPSPLTMWGQTHMTSVRFTRKRDTAAPQVTKVQPLNSSSGDDLVALTFDKPIYGFPVGAISSTTRSGSNYRIVVGRLSDRDLAERFEATDPRTGGTSASSVEFDDNDPYKLLLHLPSGLFDDETRYKLFIEPVVEDIYGVPVGGTGILKEGNL